MALFIFSQSGAELRIQDGRLLRNNDRIFSKSNILFCILFVFLFILHSQVLHYTTLHYITDKKRLTKCLQGFCKLLLYEMKKRVPFILTKLKIVIF